MLHGDGYMLVVYVVRVAPLLSENRGLAHLRVHIPVLSVVFPEPRPARVASGVERRVERPRNVGCTGLVGGDFTRPTRDFPVEGRGDGYRLRKERAVADVCRAVDVVKSEQRRYAHNFQ